MFFRIAIGGIRILLGLIGGGCDEHPEPGRFKFSKGLRPFAEVSYKGLS